MPTLNKQKMEQKTKAYLQKLCIDIPTRQVGSEGNRRATRLFHSVMEELGYATTVQPFDCLDMRQGEILLSMGDRTFSAHISPYSLGCDVQARLMQATTIRELEQTPARGCVLLLRGELTREQLMPKNFVFYNPEHHQRIYRLLEDLQPAAVIAATGRNPQLAGALYPFPLFEDGDFDIPSAYMTEEEGEQLGRWVGQPVRLHMDAQRIAASAENVIATKAGHGKQKMVVCAHIDAKAGTPGALDNAAGTIVLLLLADLLRDTNLEQEIEIVAFNGEDYYSAGGQMAYLAANQGQWQQIRLAINLDGVGYRKHPTGVSFYNCPPELEQTARAVLARYPAMQEMAQWPQGDHMIFVSQQVAAMALTTTAFDELEAKVAHTAKDLPKLVDDDLLVEAAFFVRDVLLAV